MLQTIEVEALEISEAVRLDELETVIERGQQTFIEVGNALMEIRDSRLYKRDFKTFEEYCEIRWNWKRAHAYRLIEAAEVVNEMSPIGDIEQIPIVNNEAQARELAKVEDKQERLQVWQTVNEIASIENKPVTAKLVEQVAAAIRNPQPHVSHNSGNNEWYTPPDIIEAARHCLGSIDLDPATSEFANQTVKAAEIFTVLDNGLTKTWNGNVWLNPPYSSELIGKFTAKLKEHYLSGDIQQAICLVNNATETTWFQSLLASASAVCFLARRVKFIDPAGNPSGAPLQGQALLYLGDNRTEFAAAFAEFGAILYA